MSIKRLLLLLFALAGLESCAVKFPDVKVYSVAGRLQAGMDWASTGHDETGEIGMADSIAFLETGALCMSSVDYLAQKNAIEEACYLLGPSCSYEVKSSIRSAGRRISVLMARSKASRK